MRGAVFENLAVIELLKERFNKGETDNLYFYRENSGREVDIIQTFANRLRLYEVKSSKTYNKSFTRNITYLNELFGDSVESGIVVYDGESFPPIAVNVREI